MRFESQCVEAPVEINLPRPRIRLNNDPVRYLKSIPKFQAHFVQEAGISFHQDANYERTSPVHQYKSTLSDDLQGTGQDSDDMISSIENLSNNEASLSYNPIPIAIRSGASGSGPNQNSSCECTSEEQSYKRLPLTDNADVSAAIPEAVPIEPLPALTSGLKAVESQSTLAEDEEEEEDDVADDNRNGLRSYIHYCLYVFHGLYNPDKIRDFSKQRLEFRIRTHMLNFKFVDAFTLCLNVCDTSGKSLKIFEYFTKDTSFVPMRRKDLKFFIYYLFMHFIGRKFDMLECERFFLADLDYYLIELSYVLYFNNNNTVLEQNLNQKFKSLIAQDPNQNDNEYEMEDTDAIFDSLSVKFKAIICQRLLKHCSC